MIHTEYITMCMKQYIVGDPIYTADLAELFTVEYQMEEKQAKAAVSVAIKRVMERAFQDNSIRLTTPRTSALGSFLVCILGEDNGIIYLEVLRDDDEDSVRMAPLFDEGVSLLFSTYGDEKLLKEVDVMRDFPVNNYIGAKSLEYNLSEDHINKVWEMIWNRWCYFEQIRNQEK